MNATQTAPQLGVEEFSQVRKIKNALKNLFGNPYNIIVMVTILLLVYLIVVPLIDMISTTFEAAQRFRMGTGVNVGDFTLFYWNRLLFRRAPLCCTTAAKLFVYCLDGIGL